MSDPRISVSFPAIDASAINRNLQATRSDRLAFQRALVNTFTNGSRAACETTACFLVHCTQTVEDATVIADMIKSLSTAVSGPNSRPLARVAAKIAVSFDESTCAAPLEAFVFAETYAKRHAFDETVAQINFHLSKSGAPPLTALLRRTRVFFQHLVVDADPICRYDVIRALTSLVQPNRSLSSSSSQEIGHFLLSLHMTSSPFYELSPNDDDDQAFEPFLMSSIADLLPFSDKYIDFIRTIVIRAFDFHSPTALQAIFRAQPHFVARAIRDIGVQVFAYLFVLIAATHASRGHFFPCEETLAILSSIMSKVPSNTQRFHSVISSTIGSLCIATISLATVAGAYQVVTLSTAILNDVQKNDDALDAALSKSNSELLSQCETMLHNAEEQNYPATALAFVLLRTLLETWSTPSHLEVWMSHTFSDMMRSRFLHREPPSSAHSFSQNFGGQATDTKPTISDGESHTVFEETSCISLLTVSVSLVCLYHSHPRVRMSAVRTLADFQHTPTMVFCLPSFLVCLQEESEPVIALCLLQDVILSEALTRQRASSTLSIGAILRIMRAVSDTDAVPMIQACLVAISKAGHNAPGIATAVLQKEGEKLRERFDSTKAPERIGISAAILTLVAARPTRGVNFVPLIAKCITKESMDIAPEATSLCFDAMYVMIQEGILDPIKTVKVVLKELPKITKVNVGARRSFLRLLGCVSSGSSSKKGLVLAEKVIPTLRDAITTNAPSVEYKGQVQQTLEEGVLSWDEVGEAALSLAQFTVEELLRVEYVRIEPLIDLEAERQRLERMQKECAAFVEHVLTTLSVCRQAKVCRKLQRLLNKVAKHEWDIRPRGAFDPERIAKLSATTDALRRARMTRSGDPDMDSEDNSELERFRKGVQSMPSGVIKMLCARCAKMDAGALRAVASAGAVTTAIPWAPMLNDAAKSAQAHVASAAMNVLWNALIDEPEFARVRSLNITVSRSKVQKPEEIVEVFLGCVKHYEERVSVVAKSVDTTESAEAILEALCLVEKGNESLIAGRNGIIIMERMAGVWRGDARNKWEKIIFEQCYRSNGDDGKIALEEMETCSTQIRLLCKYNEAGILRKVVGKTALDDELMKDEQVVREIGLAISNLSKSSRRKFICELAEQGGRVRAMVACQAIGGAVAFPDVRQSLTCSLALCESGERVALLKLRSDVFRL